ncbi:hypothetical protein Mp_8g14770 [Marchantia polymorpha subsp. ruderalis]|uniref:Uncharacterized protein n=1 Tax=Marchantia polymorpha TaxID=3197 RepID=A0A2R6W527_MARPO|nr:hypothetical protein MARPO_0151s0029 [Marchantia polymorpha]BBN19908.1 hypothetical protein Mp_8g14770 [Marchantia polymorpha subsp. ruderalis]|eukprot:PTQ28956.1 hypothetical protein MARPO_0151s0029 [Marchantia polymorpha]
MPCTWLQPQHHRFASSWSEEGKNGSPTFKSDRRQLLSGNLPELNKGHRSNWAVCPTATGILTSPSASTDFKLP